MKTYIIVIFGFSILLILFTLFYNSKNYDEPFDVINHNTNNELLNMLTNENLQLTTVFNIPNFKNFKYVTELDKNIEYILIIDMPNYGGGTTFFINSIISMFKKRVTFLIARNFNNATHFYINDDVNIDKPMNETESITFINNNKQQISKIFVNHTANHFIPFLDTLFTLDKKVTTITHDYSLIFNKTQLFYNEIQSANIQRYAIDIKRYNEIITQNIVNLEIYKKYLGDQSVIVCPLPDYKNRLIQITSNNKKIVIGIIGNISEIKGAKLVGELLNWCLDNSEKYVVIIFGSINVDYKNQYPYKDINELNSLLSKFKPNILVETSIWPETYSYTLSLSMITELPIMFIKKKFPSVIENRLSKCKNAFSYDNIKDMYSDFELKKQNHFYTIEPNIYFNSFWEHYFQ